VRREARPFPLVRGKTAAQAVSVQKLNKQWRHVHTIGQGTARMCENELATCSHHEFFMLRRKDFGDSKLWSRHRLGDREEISEYRRVARKLPSYMPRVSVESVGDKNDEE
jgi:hypothetical protein